MSEKQRYSTIDDVVAYAIEPMCGEFPDDYDVYAIANELFEFTSDVDEDGIQRGNAYFIEREGVDWEDIMVRHDHGEELDKIVDSAWDGDGTYSITEINGGVTEVGCSEKRDLKHGIYELFLRIENWDEKLMIAKIDEDRDMTEKERIGLIKLHFDETRK